MKAVKIDIYGKVQGVWFRASTEDKARELNIKGNVKNMPDGSVHIHAEGNSNALDQFLLWCHEGPPAARVDGLKVHEAEVEGHEFFNIVR